MDSNDTVPQQAATAPSSTGDAPGPGGRSAPLARGDAAYLSSVQEALEAQSAPGSTATLLVMAALLVLGVAWSAVATVEEVTAAEARVVPASREQVISSLEGGVLAAILVAEGQVVERDQPLMRLDETRFGAQVDETRARVLALRASIARLQAESREATPVYPAEVHAAPSLVDNENAVLASRRRMLGEAQAALRRSVDLVRAEIAVSRKMAEKGLYSFVELGRLQRQENELEMQIAERTNRFRAEADGERARLAAELAQIEATLAARRDSLDRTTLRAPIRGVVKNIRTGTLGASVQPGAPMMELVPLDGDLLLEARLKPSDVGFVRTGLPASVKITAYDYTVFGDLKGVVRSIGPDTMRDEPRTTPQADAGWYRVLVATDRPALQAGNRDWPIIPGMTGHVEIRTGEKTILDYLLKPVFRAKEALRER
jgi:adhesin transport system membrane fusion protein